MNHDRYYVLWPDGQKFGPADVPTLQRWIVENRVGPATLLEEASSGRHLRATDHPQLRSLLPVGMNLPVDPMGFQPANPSSGVGEVRVAWALGAVGLVCFGMPLAIAGLVLAIIAHTKRQPTAIGAIAFNAVVLLLHVIGFGLPFVFWNR